MTSLDGLGWSVGWRRSGRVLGMVAAIPVMSFLTLLALLAS